MTRKRLRNLPMPNELANMYAVPHDHARFGQGHDERVKATIRMLETELPVGSVADMSCGNAVIPRAAGAPVTLLGDFAPGYAYTGRLEDTVPKLPVVDLYTCCETLEHVDDPDAVLRLIRDRANRLLLSTPIDAWDDANGEHLWAWSREDVEAMLTDAGFTVVAFDNLDALALYGETYNYGIWLAE